MKYLLAIMGGLTSGLLISWLVYLGWSFRDIKWFHYGYLLGAYVCFILISLIVHKLYRLKGYFISLIGHALPIIITVSYLIESNRSGHAQEAFYYFGVIYLLVPAGLLLTFFHDRQIKNNSKINSLNNPNLPLKCPSCNKTYDETWSVCLTCNEQLIPNNS